MAEPSRPDFRIHPETPSDESRIIVYFARRPDPRREAVLRLIEAGWCGCPNCIRGSRGL